jgi:hypothetical protein
MRGADPSDVVNYLRTATAVEVYVRGALMEHDPAYEAAALRSASLAIERWGITNLPHWLRSTLSRIEDRQ